MVEIAEIGDRQLLLAPRSRVALGVVLVHENGIEELLVTGDAVNVAEPQVLVIERVVVRALQLVQQLCGGGRRGDVPARTGTVLTRRPRIHSAPATSSGAASTLPGPTATSRWPVIHISSCAHAACNSVPTVVWCERASSLRAA